MIKDILGWAGRRIELRDVMSLRSLRNVEQVGSWMAKTRSSNNIRRRSSDRSADPPADESLTSTKALNLVNLIAIR